MEIIANLPWLRTLRGDMSSTTTSMQADSADAVNLPSCPSVDGGTTSFMNEWDERRGELATSLQSLEDLVQAIHDAFDTASTQLGDCTSGTP